MSCNEINVHNLGKIRDQGSGISTWLLQTFALHLSSVVVSTGQGTSIKNVPWPHNMGTGWGQIWPQKSFETIQVHLKTNLSFSLLLNLFLASYGLKWPLRSDLTSSGPHIVVSRNIFYLMIYPQNLLPSMTFPKNGNFRDHFFGIQDMLEAAIVIQFLQFLVWWRIDDVS